MSTDWNAIYEAQGVVQKEPSPAVLSAIDRFQTRGLSRILDLGCGTGRHTTLLVDRGFEVYGCDCSSTALRIVADLIAGLDVRQCDMSSLPYEPDFFDGVICNQVIQHGCLADVQKACAEITRVIRPGGHLFLSVVSTAHRKAATGREIEPNTRVDTDSLDGHIPHHFFSENELRTFFTYFEIDQLDHVISLSDLDLDKESATWEMYARKPHDRIGGL
ncbi:MAG: class I SAM-dependent methyltransferase [Spartobacteria bacterium]|nr:class I SAM-dependent methyltransferase [Spartobacteria bacterium]